MYDVLLKFASAAEAKRLLPTYTTDGTSWDMANVIPDVKVYNQSQNLLSTLVGGLLAPIFVNGYFTWVALRSVPKEQTDMVQLWLCYNREDLAARKPNSIYRYGLSFVLLNDLRATPIYQGADIPWGDLARYA